MNEIDPGIVGLRCKRCGAIFTLLEMLDAYADIQRDQPQDYVFIKCPGCGIEESVPDPRPQIPFARPPIL